MQTYSHVSCHNCDTGLVDVPFHAQFLIEILASSDRSRVGTPYEYVTEIMLSNGTQTDNSQHNPISANVPRADDHALRLPLRDKNLLDESN